MLKKKNEEEYPSKNAVWIEQGKQGPPIDPFSVYGYTLKDVREGNTEQQRG